MQKRTLLIFTLVCVLLTGYAFSSDVTDLSGKKYFPAVKEAIDNSEKSIFMVMYIVDFDERDTKLMNVNHFFSLATIIFPYV